MGHLGWLFKLNLHPRHQHCTDEAQKAETVLSAVSYITLRVQLNCQKEKAVSILKKKVIFSYLPNPLLSTPSHVKSVLISFKCPASSGNSLSVEKKKNDEFGISPETCAVRLRKSRL